LCFWYYKANDIKEVKLVKLARLRNVTAILVSTIMLVSTPAAVFAATSKTTTPTAGTQNLRVSPVRTDLSVNKGSSGTVKTFVTNLTAAPVTVKPIENDFVAGDERGTPALILNENSYAPTHSLKRFMVPLSNITIAPKATQEVDVTIRVPATAQAGGYFGAIRFAPISANNQQVNVSGSVASLILMTVPGDLVETLALTNFDVQQHGGSGTNFRTPNDLSLLLRFQNKGNVQEEPFGQIYVQKGKKVLYTYNFNNNDPKQSVLPDSARRWDIPLKGFSKFGKYTVGATFTYGSKGTSIEVTKTIWIIPTAYIIAALAIIIFIILLIFGITKFLKGYKKRILRESNRTNHRGGGFGPSGGSFGGGPRPNGGNGHGPHQASVNSGANHSNGSAVPGQQRPAGPVKSSYPPRRPNDPSDGNNSSRNRF
jgi:hypothetical protein